MADPVIVTPNIFVDDTIAFVSQDTGDQIVEEGTVMADDKNGSGVINQELFKKIEGVGIEIVGGFIQD